MPAARYWRLIGLEAHAGADLELSALHLYDAVGRLDAAATLASTIAPSVGLLAALQDADLAGTCRFAAEAVRASGFAIIWDFGASSAADVIGLRLAGPSRDVFLSGCTLEYSADGRLWQWRATFSRYEFPGPATYTEAPAGLGDPSFARVALLLHMNGAGGSTVFSDSSERQKAVTASGGAAVSAAQSRFGGGSLFLDGAGDYLSAPQSSEYVFGAGDFSVELWIKTTTSAEKVLVDQFLSGSPSWQLSVKGGKLLWYSSGSALTGTRSVNDNQWHHVAATRESGVLRFFVDGVLDGSASLTTNYSSGVVLGIGAQVATRNAAYDFPGYIDELRITKGEARYTATFPVPASPFPDAAASAGGTVFLPPLLRAGGPALIRSAASSAVPSVFFGSAQRARVARDVEFGGAGRIWGTTKAKGTPSVPTRSRVVLLHQRSKLPVREVWSDPTTGDFAFEGIDVRQEFLTLTEDAAGNFRPVAASRLVPEVAP